MTSSLNRAEYNMAIGDVMRTMREVKRGGDPGSLKRLHGYNPKWGVTTNRRAVERGPYGRLTRQQLGMKTASDGGSGTGGTGTGGGGLSSATGLPAPNAGTTGSWLTLNLRDKKRGQARRVEVTKSASFDAGIVNTFTKLAYGRNSSVGPTTDRDGPQTRGEVSAERSSTGVTNMSYAPARPLTTRKPGSQGGRDVPEWLRLLKHLHSPATWTGGDKVGPRPSDNQFETPKENV